MHILRLRFSRPTVLLSGTFLYKVREAPLALAANERTKRRSTHTQVLLRRRQYFGTISRQGRALYFVKQRLISIPTLTRQNRSFTRARTARRFPCLSLIKRELSSMGTTQRICMPTAYSTFQQLRPLP